MPKALAMRRHRPSGPLLDQHAKQREAGLMGERGEGLHGLAAIHDIIPIIPVG